MLMMLTNMTCNDSELNTPYQNSKWLLKANLLSLLSLSHPRSKEDCTSFMNWLETHLRKLRG